VSVAVSGRAARPRILFVCFDYPTWRTASHLGYNTQLGLEDGLRATTADVLMLPSLWLPRAPSLWGRARFDQVWVEMLHTPLPAVTLDWLTGLAPIRLGFIPESLDYHPEEYATLRDRLGRAARRRAEAHFAVESHAQAVLRAYRHLLSSGEGVSSPRVGGVRSGGR